MTRVAALFCLAVAGCSSGTETGNPDDVVRLGIGALPDRPPLALDLDEARVSVRSLSLSDCEGVLGEEAVAGPLDLLAADGATLRAIRPERDTCGVILELAPLEASEPSELAGLTLRFSGARADGARFTVSSTLSRHIPLISRAGASLDTRRLFAAFDLALWLDAADVGSLPLVDGVVVIDASQNPDALAALDAATVRALAVYLDANQNGTLEVDERTPIATGE
jgi:hypothetical protein